MRSVENTLQVVIDTMESRNMTDQSKQAIENIARYGRKRSTPAVVIGEIFRDGIGAGVGAILSQTYSQHESLPLCAGASALSMDLLGRAMANEARLFVAEIEGRKGAIALRRAKHMVLYTASSAANGIFIPSDMPLVVRMGLTGLAGGAAGVYRARRINQLAQEFMWSN